VTSLPGAAAEQAAGGFTVLGRASLALGLTALACHIVGFLAVVAAVVATIRSYRFVEVASLGANAICFGVVLSLAGLVLGAVAWYAGNGARTAGILGCLVSGAPLGVLLGVFLLAWFLSPRRPAATHQEPPAHDFIMPWEH
jgi:hypothetical protein